MADDASPETNAPVSGEVAAIAAEANKTAAEAAGTVAAIAEHTETAVEEIAEELEDETQWLREKLESHETKITAMGEAISKLPQLMEEAITRSISEGLKLLTPPNSQPITPEGEKNVVTKENPVEAVAAQITEPIKKGIRYL